MRVFRSFWFDSFLFSIIFICVFDVVLFSIYFFPSFLPFLPLFRPAAAASAQPSGNGTFLLSCLDSKCAFATTASESMDCDEGCAKRGEEYICIKLGEKEEKRWGLV